MNDTAVDNAAIGSDGSGEQPNGYRNATSITRDEIEGVMSHVLKIVGPHFTDAEKARLKVVSSMTDLVGYHDWVVDHIGCPIHQAGIERGYSGAELFSQHFDSCVYDLLREHGQDKSEAETPQVLVVT